MGINNILTSDIMEKLYSEQGLNIVIPEGYTGIAPDYTFDKSKKIQSVTIPASLTLNFMDRLEFFYCSELKAVDDHPLYSSEGGVLFSKDKTELLRYPRGKDDVDCYAVPDGVKRIKACAFKDCELEHIEIPDGVTHIGEHAFGGCEWLKTLELPDTLTHIGEWAFRYCRRLKHIKLPAAITQIGDLFSGCYRLAEVILPPNLQSIDLYNEGFLLSNCNALANINVPAGGNSAYASENGVLFSKDKTRLITYPRHKKDEEYTIPDSVKIIEPKAFHSCYFLEHINIPKSVTIIREKAFSSCDDIRRVVIPDSVTDMAENAFQWCFGLKHVVLPAALEHMRERLLGYSQGVYR